MDSTTVNSPLIAEICDISSFLNEFDWLVEAHGVRFITRGYEKLVPQDWYDALLQLDELSIYQLPSLFDEVFDAKNITIPDSLRAFLRKCRLFSGPVLPEENPLSRLSLPPLTSSVEPLRPIWETDVGVPLTKGMTPKKRHEVERLADLIYRVCLAHDCPNVLDLGCGQGYLMQVLSFYYKLDVLGVDSSSLQTNGAKKRAQQTQLLMRGLFRKHKHIDASQVDLTPVFMTLICPIDTSINMARLATIAAADVKANPPPPPLPENYYPKKYEPIPFRQAPVHPLLSEKGVILVGLHTCGDLAPTTLRLFHESPTVKAMINIGCCYNLMTESTMHGNGENGEIDVASSSNATSDGKSDKCDENCESKHHIGGYPLSAIAKERMPRLTRTARVLACQSVCKRKSQVERTLRARELADAGNSEEERNEEAGDADEGENFLPIDLVHRSQVFRAVLQYIYEAYYENQTNNYSGQYSREYLSTFAKYCAHLIKRQNMPTKLSDDEIEEIWKKHGEPNYLKLVAFDNLRVCLSPVIETLILKDRLLFLQEQNASTQTNFQHTSFPIFDATISPRNIAFLSTKFEAQ